MVCGLCSCLNSRCDTGSVASGWRPLSALSGDGPLSLGKTSAVIASIAHAVPVLARRHSYPNRVIRGAARRFVSANAWVLVSITGITVTVCALLAWLLDGYVAGLFTGVFASLMVAMVALGFLLLSGLTFQVSGVMGESNTANVLRIARRRKYVYGWIDNLEIDSGDVDHLVVTRAGVLAIDSKWHSHGLSEARLESDAIAALACAGRARNILRSVQHRHPVVTPLVVVWGGNQADAHGQHHRGVEFVSGQELKAWLKARIITGNAFNDSQARALLGELEAFKRRVRPPHRDPLTSARGPSTRRRAPRQGRVGV